MAWKLPSVRTYQVRCPDGTVKTVHRNVDDAFPLYVQGWKANLGADLGSLLGGANMSAAVVMHIQGLLFGLDELNQSLMLNFRGAYVAYMNDPCTNSGFFDRQVEQVLDRLGRLQAAKVQIQGLIALAQVPAVDRAAFADLFQQVVSQLGPSAAPAGARAAISDARETAKRWAETGNGS